MKILKNDIVLVLLIIITFVSSCTKKESSLISATSATAEAVSNAAAIAVGVSAATNDSIYVVGTCMHGHHLDSVAAASLPAAVTVYLDSAYTNYTFVKAFTDKDSGGTISGYVVIITFNGKPVGLKFDASGNFEKVLEQREGKDLEGKGWHHGGCFGDRDGMQQDTIAISSLPQNIASYFSENYPQDTLIKAYKNADSTFIVFSMNNGVYATTFTADGVFINRVLLHYPQHDEKMFPLPANELPDAVTTYLTATYPGYVLKQAFALMDRNSLAGYVAAIDADGTKYAVEFDAAGNFIKAVTIQ